MWLIFVLLDIEAECQDDYMKIRVGFNGTFTGLVYSAGKNKLTICTIVSIRE